MLHLIQICRCTHHASHRPYRMQIFALQLRGWRDSLREQNDLMQYVLLGLSGYRMDQFLQSSQMYLAHYDSLELQTLWLR